VWWDSLFGYRTVLLPWICSFDGRTVFAPTHTFCGLLSKLKKLQVIFQNLKNLKLLQVFLENLIKLVGADKDTDIDIEKDKDIDTEYVLYVFRSKSFWLF